MSAIIYGGLNVLSLYHLYETPDAQLHRDFQLFSENNIGYIALNLYWYNIETARGQYNTTFLENVKRICRIAALHNLKVLVTFHTLWSDDGTWCTPSYVIDPYSGMQVTLAIVRSSDMRQAFINMVQYVVNYLTGTVGIWAWALLNEPWYWSTGTEHDFVTDNGKTQKENFLDLFATLANIVKSGDGRPTTIRFINIGWDGRNLFDTDWNWDQRIFNSLDFIGLNAYIPLPTDPTYSDVLAKTTANVQGCQQRGKAVWVTEFGAALDDDEAQRQVYRFNMDTYFSLSIAGVLAWNWMSDVAPAGWTQIPEFGTYDLARPDGSARPAFYEMATRITAPLTHSLVVNSSPITGVPITADGYQYSTPTQPLTLQEGTHIIVAPSTVLAGSDVYNFVRWEDGSTNPTRTINLTADLTITCIYQLQAPPPVTHSLIVTAGTGGTTNPVPGRYDYNEGASAIVTAIPDSGYRFDHWELDGTTRTENSVIVVMDMDYSLRAVFEYVPVQYTLTISSSSGGSTSPSPGQYSHQENTTINVQAVANSGYFFDHWDLDGTVYTTNPISVLMNRTHVLIAYFSASPPPPPTTYKLTIGVTIGGTTVPSPATYTINEGQAQQVIALPSTNYQFLNWFLDGNSITDNPISVLMNQDHTLQAIFQYVPPATFNLFVSSSAGGSTSPASGEHQYPENTSVNVQATPQSGYYFDHWDLDGITYTSNPITVLMNKNHSLVAYFSPSPPPPPATYKLGVNASIGGTTEPAQGIYDYTANTAVMLTATPNTGYVFDHWELDGQTTTSNPLTIVMDKDHLALAVFKPFSVQQAGFPIWIISVALLGVGALYLAGRKK